MGSAMDKAKRAAPYVVFFFIASLGFQSVCLLGLSFWWLLLFMPISISLGIAAWGWTLEATGGNFDNG